MSVNIQEQVEQIRSLQKKSIFGAVKGTFINVLDAVDNTVVSVNNLALASAEVTDGWQQLAKQNKDISLEESAIEAEMSKALLNTQKLASEDLLNNLLTPKAKKK